MGIRDEEHLRRFVAARGAGDDDAMRRWWGEVVTDVFDRLDGFVGAAHRGRLDADEHERAVAAAAERLALRMVHTWAGRTMGELVNATHTMARGICIDEQRTSIRRRAREGLTLDTGWDAGPEDRGGPTRAEVAEAGHALERADEQADVRDFLAWALPQILQTRRAVLELDLRGVPLEEIVAELGITRDNAYQRRRRGREDLGRLWRTWTT